MLSIAKKQCVVKEICAKNTAKSKRGKGLAAFARKGDTKRKKENTIFCHCGKKNARKGKNGKQGGKKSPSKTQHFQKRKGVGFFTGRCGVPVENPVETV